MFNMHLASFSKENHKDCHSRLFYRPEGLPKLEKKQYGSIEIKF